TMFMDVVTNFGSSKSPYIPVDADHLERGPVRLRSALQFSLNIPAVKALDDNGVTHVFEMAEKFGFRFQTSKPSAGLSLTLGTQEVHPVDEATAYGTLANGGQYVGRTMILAVKGSDGKDLITPYKPPTPQQVVSPQAAYIITNILEGNTTPSVNPIWGKFEIESSGGKHRPATLKTGTNDDARDLFAAGYIAPPTAAQRKAGQYALAVAAWNGNSDNSLVGSRSHPIFSTDSVTYEWQGFLQEATSKWAIDDFAVPNGLVKAKVDAWSGMKPGPFTTKTVDEYFIDGTQPKQVDDTKVPIQVQSGTNLLWQDGCDGSPVTKGFADFNNVESSKPPWQAADRAWAARAARGIGVAGGPEHTRTMTFYDGGFHPFGNSWGAPFPPTKTCQIPVATPFPTPSCEAAASDCPSPSSSPSGSLSPPPTKPPKKTPKPTPPPSATTGTGGTGGVGDTGGGPVPSVGP
ncbi:MAG TPA: penicillin-binding transpeptidase domain-containing protein, partial [Candidatus Limnocylindrales bacterium]|nr:penicillin-binding transpeptidase domain-containing protein [Candidatus Limnocylindrales bacterium]